MSNVYDFVVKSIEGHAVPLSTYRGQVDVDCQRGQQ